MNKITFKKQAAQGDLLITRVESFPSTGLKKAVVENGVYTVAHSETGHNHVVSSAYAECFDVSDNELVSYIKVTKDTDLSHLRGFDTHETITIEPGMYRINRQREYIAEGFRKAQD